MRVEKIVPWVLGVGAALFVAALAGVGSGLVTRERPTTSTTTIAATTTTAATGTTSATATTVTTTTTTPAADGPTITIEGFAFGDPITVAVGTEVTVINADATGHTWTSQAGLFDSGTLRGGDTFVFTFAEAGEYRFFCGIHPTMTGSITVTG